MLGAYTGWPFRGTSVYPSSLPEAPCFIHYPRTGREQTLSNKVQYHLAETTTPHTHLSPPPTKLQVDFVLALHTHVHAHTRAHTLTHGCTEPPQITKRSENKLSVQCKAQAGNCLHVSGLPPFCYTGQSSEGIMSKGIF